MCRVGGVEFQLVLKPKYNEIEHSLQVPRLNITDEGRRMQKSSQCTPWKK